MNPTDVLVFDVGLGQSIFIYPHSHPEYGMLVDCGNTEEFDPIDFLLDKNYISNGILSNLTLTNYDQDHFSGMPYLREKVQIRTVNFAKNLSSSEIKAMKEDVTEALEHTCAIKDTYIHPAPYHQPPYVCQVFHLNKEHLQNPDTNNLSQVVFVEHHGTVICISGDIEEIGWKTLLATQPAIKDWLKKTNILIASHHGRENGYCSEVFTHCSPECVIISDKEIIHDTQRDMYSTYGGHVNGDGVRFAGELDKRKVLTTRDDGHVYIRLLPEGIRSYGSFVHEEVPVRRLTPTM